MPAEPNKLSANFQELEIWTQKESSEALQVALNEIKPEDYVGSYPPRRSYEAICKGAELFAFAWDSNGLDVTCI